MRITVAIDSFKGSLSSLEAGQAVREAADAVFEECDCRVLPLADGGEGTVDAVVTAKGGRIVSTVITGPLGKPTVAKYGVCPDGTAVIEMSEAAGLPLVPVDKRNPMNTTTYGVGELILGAIGEGCRKFILGIGGSATNDAGAGMLMALGAGLYDREGGPVPLGARGLSELCSVDISTLNPILRECSFSVACDVKNPLCGELGASAVFGPQKGADAECVALLDSYLSKFADLTEQTVGSSHKDDEGAGAAGGLGFALISYLGAELCPGIDLIAGATDIESSIKESDLVITGEGRLDRQSSMGKAPVGVARLAKKHGVPVIALCGSVTNDAGRCNDVGIDAYFSVLTSPMTLSEAMEPTVAITNMRNTAEQALRLFKVAGSYRAK